MCINCLANYHLTYWLHVCVDAPIFPWLVASIIGICFKYSLNYLKNDCKQHVGLGTCLVSSTPTLSYILAVRMSIQFSGAVYSWVLALCAMQVLNNRGLAAEQVAETGTGWWWGLFSAVIKRNGTVETGSDWEHMMGAWQVYMDVHGSTQMYTEVFVLTQHLPNLPHSY